MRRRFLADRDFLYVWMDGVHVNIRLEDDRLAALVVVEVRPDETKEAITIKDALARGRRGPAIAAEGSVNNAG